MIYRMSGVDHKSGSVNCYSSDRVHASRVVMVSFRCAITGCVNGRRASYARFEYCTTMQFADRTGQQHWSDFLANRRNHYSHGWLNDYRFQGDHEARLVDSS